MRIYHIHWIIPAVHVQVRPGQGCDHHAVCADEPPDLRIVVPALQVVHACLFVPVVAAVAEGVPFPDGACQGSGGADGVAPGIVFIFYYQRPARVNQARDVVLGVPDKQRSPAIRFATCCYTRPHCGPVYIPVAARRHPDQLPISIVDLHSFLHSVPDKHFLFPNHSPEADSSSVKKAQPLPFITELQKLCFL